MDGRGYFSSGFRADGMVRLSGANITGELNCSGGTFNNPRARYDTDARALVCDGMVVNGGVLLNNGFVAQGEVRLPHAKIHGQLECRGGIFNNPRSIKDPNAYALNCDGISVERGIFLNDGFHAHGAVRFPGADIRGPFFCRAGLFSNDCASDDGKPDALVCDGMSVHDDVYFDGGFRATGEVRLPGTTIAGYLSCTGGSFSNPQAERSSNSVALRCDNMAVAGDVNLTGSFFASGEVRLLHARIVVISVAERYLSQSWRQSS